MSEAIRGFWVAMATPLDARGDIDHAALVRHANWLMAQSCDGLVLFGTTGEGPSFSASERLAATEALLTSGIEARRIGLGAGYPAIADAVRLTRSAMALGLRHVLFLPPYFYRDVDADGIEQAFARTFDAVGDDRLRATLYHIPQVSGVAVPAEVVGRLRARYGGVVAGVKDSSGDFSHFQAFRAAAPEVAIAVGNEADIARALAAGGAGTICGMGNLIPDLVRRMFDDPSTVVPMRAAIALMQGPFVPLLKAALAAMTAEPEWQRVRSPLIAAAAEAGQHVAAGLQALRQAKAA